MSHPSAFAFFPPEPALRHIFEQSVVGIFQSSIEGRNLLANPAFARLLGYESPAELTLTITDVARQFYVDPDRRGEVNEKIARNGGHVEECESLVWRRDGGVMWITENTRIILDAESGRPVYLGSIADITARKRSELALAESEERLRREVARRCLAETMLERWWPHALFVCDAAGSLEFCSERAADLLRAHYSLPSVPASVPASLMRVISENPASPASDHTVPTPRGKLVIRSVAAAASEGMRVYTLEEP